MTYPIEVIERRSRFEKHFETAPGEFDAKTFSVPVHYQHEGEWLDIRPEWSKDGNDLVLSGVPYEGRIRGRTVGADGLLLVDYEGAPDVRGHRVWWHAIAPDTSAVLIASATHLQLHLVIWGPRAPKEWIFFSPSAASTADDWQEFMRDAAEAERTCITASPPSLVSGRDNIERYVEREGPDQHYELDMSWRVEGDFVMKRWSGKVKAIDPVTRQKRLSDDVAYPVRIT